MQKSDENEEKYQLGDYLFIQNQILGDRMADSKENYKLDLGSDFQINNDSLSSILFCSEFHKISSN